MSEARQGEKLMVRLRTWPAMMAIGLVLAWGGGAEAQLPTLPIGPKPAEAPRENPAEKPVAVPTKDSPEAVFATTSGPIQVSKKVDDAAVGTTLDDLLVQYPGVRHAAVKVQDGVVTLEGQADDRDTLSNVTDFVKKVEGVRLVLNLMKTDDQVLNGRELAAKALGEFGFIVRRYWLLAIVALVVGMAFAGLARLFARYSETLLA